MLNLCVCSLAAPGPWLFVTKAHVHRSAGFPEFRKLRSAGFPECESSLASPYASKWHVEYINGMRYMDAYLGAYI